MENRLSTKTAEQIESAPLYELAELVLERIVATSAWNAPDFIRSLEEIGIKGKSARACSEALNWLITKGLIAQWKPGQQSSGASMFVMRLGDKAAGDQVEFSGL